MKDFKIVTKASSTNMSDTKDTNSSDATPCNSSSDATSCIKERDMDRDYYCRCYPGSAGLLRKSDDRCYSRDTGSFRTQHPTIQTDNGSVRYTPPGFQAGYISYGPFFPGAISGVEGRFWGQGSYCASPISLQSLVSRGFFLQPVTYGPELVPAYRCESPFVFPDEIRGCTSIVDQINPHSKLNFPSHTHNPAAPRTSMTKSALRVKGPLLVADVLHPTSVQSQSHKAVKATAAALSTGGLPTNKSNSYANQGKDVPLKPTNTINMKENGQHVDLLSEQSSGPRTNGSKFTSKCGAHSVEIFGAEKSDDSSRSISIINKDEYNHPDFCTEYEHALFFVIKSYSEDDIHKSIKYNVWASTQNGNKRLDNAFQVAQQKMAEKNSKCPVFLFFSVNASGQFCGVAEMIDRVDSSKNMEFWQQDVWKGFFRVKWHIIKDVPNSRLRHVILENNDNKPVTNSRDTQEVRHPQGAQMLNIFKSYSSKTSMLDHFAFYENRQKAMQEKGSKLTAPGLVLKLAKNGESTEVPEQSDS